MSCAPVDAQAFLDAAAPLLLADEPRNNLILGITGTLLEHPDRYPEKRFWVVTDHAGEPVAAAMQTPPYNLLLAGGQAGSGLEELVDGIDDELPGVVGAHPEVDEFVRLWTRSHSVESRCCATRASTRWSGCSPSRSRRAAHGARPATTCRCSSTGWSPSARKCSRRTTQAAPRPARASSSGSPRRTAASMLWEDEGEIVSLSGLGRPDPERDQDRPGLHTARAARPRLRHGARRRAVAGAAGRRPALLLPVHRPGEPDLERDLRADRLRQGRRVGDGRLWALVTLCYLGRGALRAQGPAL